MFFIVIHTLAHAVNLLSTAGMCWLRNPETIRENDSNPVLLLVRPGTSKLCDRVSPSEGSSFVAGKSGGRSGAKRTTAPRSAAACPGLQRAGGSVSSRRNAAKQGPALDAGLSVYLYRLSPILRARLYRGCCFCPPGSSRFFGPRTIPRSPYPPENERCADPALFLESAWELPGKKRLTFATQNRRGTLPPSAGASLSISTQTPRRIIPENYDR